MVSKLFMIENICKIRKEYIIKSGSSVIFQNKVRLII